VIRQLAGGFPRGKSGLRGSLGAETAVNGLRDQDRLDEASNFVIWKAKILAILDKHHIKDYALRTLAIPIDLDANEKYEEAQAKAKCMILDGVKDHVIPHIVEKSTTREMWETLPPYSKALTCSRRCYWKIN